MTSAATFGAIQSDKPPHPQRFIRKTLPREQMVCMDQFNNWYGFAPKMPAPNVYDVDVDDEGTPQDFGAPGWVKGAEELLFSV